MRNSGGSCFLVFIKRERTRGEVRATEGQFEVISSAEVVFKWVCLTQFGLRLSPGGLFVIWTCVFVVGGDK